LESNNAVDIELFADRHACLRIVDDGRQGVRLARPADGLDVMIDKRAGGGIFGIANPSMGAITKRKTEMIVKAGDEVGAMEEVLVLAMGTNRTIEVQMTTALSTAALRTVTMNTRRATVTTTAIATSTFGTRNGNGWRGNN